VVDLLMGDPKMKPSVLRDKLKKQYSVDVPYDRVVRGKFRDLDMIYGKWYESYEMLPTYQAELLRSLPGSVVELETEEHNGDVCFMRFFVALKPWKGRGRGRGRGRGMDQEEDNNETVYVIHGCCSLLFSKQNFSVAT